MDTWRASESEGWIPDGWSREDIVGRIEALAAAYVPEWRFVREKPDAGGALALIFADGMAKTAAQYGRSAKKRKVEFFRKLDAAKADATFAEGYLTFGLVNNRMPAVTLPAGTKITASSKDGGKQYFATGGEVSVQPSEAKREVFRDGNCLYICFLSPLCVGRASLLLLTASSGEAAQGLAFSNRAAKGQVLPGQMPPGQVSQGQSVPGLAPSSQGGRGRLGRRLRWEWLGKTGWEALTVQDGTWELSHSGIVEFETHEEMEKETIFAQDGYWIRAVDGGGEAFSGEVFAYLNAAEARAVSPGVQGNVTQDCEYKLTLATGFISRVGNPDVMYGGAEEEDERRALLRNAARLRHGFRAVTPRDYESLAMEASPNVLRVKCFEGYGEDGERAPGMVTVVVLQKDYLEGRRFFYRLERQVGEALRRYADPCLAGLGRIQVTAPWFARMDGDIRIYVDSFGRAGQAEQQAREALEAFMDPVVGGYDKRGWDFGTIPDYTQIKYILQNVPGVVGVGPLRLLPLLERAGRVEETELDQLKKMAWVLPISGKFRVRALVLQEGGAYGSSG